MLAEDAGKTDVGNLTVFINARMAVLSQVSDRV